MISLLPTVCKIPPRNVQIEPTNVCNLRCPLCINSRIPENEKKHLKFEEFKFILSRFEYKIHKIYLTNWGEPFLNPDIFKIIRYAKEKRIYVSLSSNLDIGKGLTGEIIKSGLDAILLSIDGLSYEAYSKYRVGANFSNVLKNMLLLKETKEKYNTDKPRITWQFLVNKYNEHEISDAVKFAGKNGIKIVVSEMGLADDMPEYNFGDLSELKKKWLPQNPGYIRDYYKGKARHHIAETVCPFLWNSITISVNMKVTPCCHTYGKESYFGDLTKNNIMEIWNNKYYRAARELFNRKNNVRAPIDIVCNKCLNYVKGGGVYCYMKHYVKLLKDHAGRIL